MELAELALQRFERLVREGWSLDVVAVDRGLGGLVMAQGGRYCLVWPDGDLTGISARERGALIGLVVRTRETQPSSAPTMEGGFAPQPRRQVKSG